MFFLLLSIWLDLFNIEEGLFVKCFFKTAEPFLFYINYTFLHKLTKNNDI